MSYQYHMLTNVAFQF